MGRQGVAHVLERGFRMGVLLLGWAVGHGERQWLVTGNSFAITDDAVRFVPQWEGIGFVEFEGFVRSTGYPSQWNSCFGGRRRHSDFIEGYTGQRVTRILIRDMRLAAWVESVVYGGLRIFWHRRGRSFVGVILLWLMGRVGAAIRNPRGTNLPFILLYPLCWGVALLGHGVFSWGRYPCSQSHDSGLVGVRR